MRWALNVVFWLVLSLLLFCGAYFLFSHVGTALFGESAGSTVAVRVCSGVLSFILTTAALAAGALCFGRR
jgi:hypothetical protein